MTYTDEKVIELARGAWFWGGINDSQYEVALRAVDLLPDDAMVLGHCLERWRYYLTPSRSSKAPDIKSYAQIRPCVDRAVAAGERVVFAPEVLGDDNLDRDMLIAALQKKRPVLKAAPKALAKTGGRQENHRQEEDGSEEGHCQEGLHQEGHRQEDEASLTCGPR